MGKKSRGKSKAGTRKPPVKSTSHATLWVSVAVLVVVGAAIYALQGPEKPQAAPLGQVRAQHETRRPFYENPEEAKPFPKTMDPGRFAVPFVSRAYEIARQIPEVLVQQPCECNCGVLGHRSLLDCYVSYHAASCAACLQEAVFAQQMTAAGRTPVEIREDIDRGLWRSVDLNGSIP